jgi:hypothetical protein
MISSVERNNGEMENEYGALLTLAGTFIHKYSLFKRHFSVPLLYVPSFYFKDVLHNLANLALIEYHFVLEILLLKIFQQLPLLPE